MVQTLTINEEIKSISDVEMCFKLRRSSSPSFFREWQEDLPELTPHEQENLDRIQKSYLFNSKEGALTEATVNLLLISPLLYLAGFCDPPFSIRAEKSVEISGEDSDNVYRGRIDILVLQHQFWLAIVESKQTKFSFAMAIPQALTYMMANPDTVRPMFGLVTNGDTFLFLKVVRSPVAEYGFSTDFSLYGMPDNELFGVLRVLKRIGQTISPIEAEGKS